MKKRFFTALTIAFVGCFAILPAQAEMLGDGQEVQTEMSAEDVIDQAAQVGAPEDDTRRNFDRIGDVVEEDPGDDESLDAGKLYDTVPDGAEYVHVHRLFNPNNGEHFYTVSVKEKNDLMPLGWQYEGVAFRAPSTASASTTDVWRLYNPKKGFEEHHYTSDLHEIEVLVSQGWIREGVAFLSVGDTGIPAYRLFNIRLKSSASHHVTQDQNEINYLKKTGWEFEGIAWYSMPADK